MCCCTGNFLLLRKFESITNEVASLDYFALVNKLPFFIYQSERVVIITRFLREGRVLDGISWGCLATFETNGL